MLSGKPFFPGNSTLNQLERIVSFTGRPKKEDVEALNSEVASTMIESISDIKTKNANEWFKADTPTEAINLVTRMLTFNPLKRIKIN
jgi:mitogen-activated protein kinase 15